MFFYIILGICILIGSIFLLRFSLQKLLLNRVKKILYSLTKTPWHGLILGTLFAALMQSSTAVSLITIGIVSADYLTFYQGLGIILGANIGTCSTVQILNINLNNDIVFYIFIFFILISILFKKFRFIFLVLSGFLGMFVGMNFITNSLENSTNLDFIIYLITLSKSNILYGILGGILITSLFQSSSIATILIMALANEGLIDIYSAAYIIYGNNIGSCLSSLIISASAPLSARRVAISHILINLLGVIFFLPFTNILIYITQILTNNFAGQVALIHTLFNIISSLIIMLIIKKFCKLIEYITPR